MRSVSINLKKSENLIKVYEGAEQKDIIKELKKKLPDLKKLYKEEKMPIRITGKALKNAEMDEIENLIKEYLDIEVKFDMPKELGLSSIVKTFNQTIKVSETKFHKGSIRSGKKMEAEGSIVILGDVNSGAEIVATDNIVVLGNLRGLAHAGAKGNKEAIVAAGTFDAVQVRIANIVKEIDRESELSREQVYIHVVGDEIMVEEC
jgi:septum site-determining protein MinC